MIPKIEEGSKSATVLQKRIETKFQIVIYIPNTEIGSHFVLEKQPMQDKKLSIIYKLLKNTFDVETKQEYSKSMQ
jgi:hypothetical protein